MLSTITAKERLRATLQRRGVDRPPFVCPGGMMNMAVTEVMTCVGESWPRAHSDAESMARLVIGVADLAGVENLGAPFCMTVEAEGMGARVDLGTSETEPRIADYAIAGLGDVDQLEFDASHDRAEVAVRATRMLVAERPDMPMIASLTGPVSLATSLVDPLVFYRGMLKDPSGAHALLDLAAQAAMAFGDALVSAGADTICIADPSSTGQLIGATGFEAFALPYINRIVEHFAARDVPAIVHICGDVKALDRMLEGVAAPAISIDSRVSFRTLRELAPSHATMGNISTYLLEYGTREALRTVAANRVADGVDIISPACGIGPRTPVSNIRAIAEAVTSTEYVEAAEPEGATV